VGSCYYYGEGVEKDHKKAFEWYSKFDGGPWDFYHCM
jgi:hypothetical protein